MIEQNLKCRDCGRPMPRREGVLVVTDHSDDCAGIRRQSIEAVADE
jgi:hypothetical protein